jgi:hypothetical protein
MCYPTISLKTKKEIDSAIDTATSLAKEIDVVRQKRQRFDDDPILRSMTAWTTSALAHTLLDSSSKAQPLFERSTTASLQPLTTALLESGLRERKPRNSSMSCAYAALTASQALLDLVRREYALSESLLAVTTALSSTTTRETIDNALKMNDAAVASLTTHCDRMLRSSDTHDSHETREAGAVDQ